MEERGNQHLQSTVRRCHVYRVSRELEAGDAGRRASGRRVIDVQRTTTTSRRRRSAQRRDWTSLSATTCPARSSRTSPAAAAAAAAAAAGAAGAAVAPARTSSAEPTRCSLNRHTCPLNQQHASRSLVTISRLNSQDFISGQCVAAWRSS